MDVAEKKKLLNLLNIKMSNTQFMRDVKNLEFPDMNLND